MKIGAYRVLRQIGGATNDRERREVFLALAEGPGGFERMVVLKQQPVASADDPELADRVVREANVYARLTHPAIVQLFDLFETDSHIVMVREYVHGLTLGELLVELRKRRIRLPDGAAFFIAARIYDALAAAHAARHPVTGEYTPVIHRDVTPTNVLVPWDGYAKLSDFGTAKLLGRTHDTAVGVIKGTLGYLAPEQVLGDPITVRTDLYGAALVAREVLTRREAFPRAGSPELEYLQRMARPRLPPIETERPDLPIAVLDALRIALEPDPERRTSSAISMVDVFRAACDLERGRRMLVDILALVREERRGVAGDAESTRDGPPERKTPRGDLSARSNPLIGMSTPAPMVTSMPPPVTAAISIPRPRPRSHLRTVIAVAATVSLAGGYIVGRRTTPRAEVHVLGGARHNPSPPPPPPPTAKPAPIAPPSDRGWLRTPIGAKAHRVFVDGRFACVGGESVHLTCGVHEVKVGSAGKKQRVEVPCGGEITVVAKW